MTTPGKAEFSSLLFTPRTGDKQSQPDYRSSRPQRSPSTPAYGRASTREGATPTRRSLTPTGSFKETPPVPPPSESMFMLESPSGAGSPILAQAPALDTPGPCGYSLAAKKQGVANRRVGPPAGVHPNQ